MNSLLKKTPIPYGAILAVCAFVFLVFGIITAATVQAQTKEPTNGERLITIHDNGHDRGILTRATTLREAFEEAGIRIDENDMVEPGLDQTLVANNYEVNVYRARPVTIVDGALQTKVMSAFRTAKQIVQQAGMTLQDEDNTTMDAPADMVQHGAGVRLVVDRATAFTLVLYGKKTTAYTQEATVGAMLEEKKITLGAQDTLSVPKNTAITAGMTVELWRNGKQTITEEQEVQFETEKILDVNHVVGFREVKAPGEKGRKTVSYEITMQNGIEVERKEIQSVVTKEPKKEILIVGVRVAPGAGLTKGKGVYQFTDSKGVTHRETYYDLPMNAVMQSCGGSYSVRVSDGVKVDQDGYVIIAANLSRYPRCSVVETSLGPGKVYDTGGFAARHPDGFDLATDWTNWDGR